MKGYIKYLLVVLVISAGLGCGGDDETPPSLQELAFEKLSGSWNLSQGGSIQVDGQDISLNYPGFALSFTDGAYTTTNAADLFKASGTWQWSDADAQRLSLDDGKAISILTLTETEFEFSFQFAGTGGRANGTDGIAGNYTISVTK